MPESILRRNIVNLPDFQEIALSGRRRNLFKKAEVQTIYTSADASHQERVDYIWLLKSNDHVTCEQ
jgi:hypothetical protein